MIETKLFSEIDFNQPHRILKYVLVWCASGSITLVVDENEFQLKSNEVITITSGQYHFFKETSNATGHLLSFTYDFFCRDDRDIELIFHNSLFCHFDLNEIVQVDLSVLLGQITKELENKFYQYHIAVHNIVELILVRINRSKLSSSAQIWKPDALFLKFLEKIRSDFKNAPQVAKIAIDLGTTVGVLNNASKKHTGKTAQSIVHSFTISEAKRILIYEKISIKEVAYALGFRDSFYFSAFFKKHTEMSPKTYREKHMLF